MKRIVNGVLFVLGTLSFVTVIVLIALSGVVPLLITLLTLVALATGSILMHLTDRIRELEYKVEKSWRRCMELHDLGTECCAHEINKVQTQINRIERATTWRVRQ